MLDFRGRGWQLSTMESLKILHCRLATLPIRNIVPRFNGDKDLTLYIQEKYIPSLNCQTRLMPSFALHERTDRLLEGNKRLGTTTIKSRGFFFGYYWLHFQIVNELSEIQRGSMDVDDIEKHNVLRLGCWWGGESILKQFLDEVLKSETGNELSIWTVAGSSIIPSHPWANHTQPSRPLDTIDLDDQIKSELREGSRIFLSRQQWYANRGIPYRRGYLFFGPAGTGKTSTAKSLASTFGGQLYTLTLDEIMDENHLQRLFSIPKKGDFILIEDIDRLDDGVTQQENVNRLVGTWRRRRRNISLSALLNAIDGPTGLNDGVILIMTSNTSELDTALVRPGRIDQTHYFPYATHDVARSIFKRLYGDDATTQESDGATSLNLDQLADEFAQQVPAETVTPAEVQGYLIARSNPSDAVRDFGAWVEDAISRSTRRCPSTQSADVVEQEDIWMQSADM